jgi:hypothetical protein
MDTNSANFGKIINPNIQQTPTQQIKKDENITYIKDIKGLSSVPDNSTYILTATSIAFTFVFIVLFILIYRYLTKIRKTKKLSKKSIARENLKTLDFSDTKNVVYSFCIDGQMFLNDKNEENFNQIVSKLEKYKYVKEAQSLEPKIKKEIQNFIKGIR